MATYRALDLNADLGEGCGHDAELLEIVTSANIACGGHAGDAASMRASIDHALERGVVVGAHPSYPDREGFGRRIMHFTRWEIQEFVSSQTQALREVAASAGATVAYVKPHGALGNLACIDRRVADAIADAVAFLDPPTAVLAMSRSALEASARERGLTVSAEIYADRAYTDEATLVPRSEPGAVLDDDGAAIERLRTFIRNGEMRTRSGGSVAITADSICVHGDNEHAVTLARRIRRLLEGEGVDLRPFCR